MNRLRRFHHAIALGLALVILTGPLSTVVVAATSRAFGSAEPLAAGTMVSLDASHDGNIIATTPDNASKLVGAVVPEGSATLQLNATGAQIQVVTSGVAAVFVSDLNGAVKTGDHITVSPLAGVGMRATDTGITIGLAQTSFSTDGSLAKTITDKAGAQREVHVGQVKVLLGVGQFAPAKSPSYIPAALQTMADTLSGRPTAAWRILSGSAIIVVTLVMIGAIVYVSIRASLTAIGRNPLSAPSIYRSLFQLVVMTVGLLFIALLSVFLILTR